MGPPRSPFSALGFRLAYGVGEDAGRAFVLAVQKEGGRLVAMQSDPACEPPGTPSQACLRLQKDRQISGVIPFQRSPPWLDSAGYDLGYDAGRGAASADIEEQNRRVASALDPACDRPGIPTGQCSLLAFRKHMRQIEITAGVPPEFAVGAPLPDRFSMMSHAQPGEGAR